MGALFVERLWYGPRGPWHWLALVALWPLSLLYGAGVWLWAAGYRWGLLRPRRVAGARVVSVGNLVAGGAGKTAVAIELARRARQLGLGVAVLSRGYGRSGTDLVRVTMPQLPAVEEVGDEPRLIARSTGVPVWVCGDRRRAALAAVEAGATVLILDDGFQHRRLARDVDLLVEQGSGGGLLLPAGPLREPVTARRRATHTWGRDGARGDIIARHVTRSAVAPGGAVVALPALGAVVLLTAVARPGRLVDELAGAGVSVVAVFAHADHHHFTGEEVAAAHAAAAAAGAVVVTTAKDAERLAVPAYVLVQEVEVLEGHHVIDELLLGEAGERRPGPVNAHPR